MAQVSISSVSARGRPITLVTLPSMRRRTRRRRPGWRSRRPCRSARRWRRTTRSSRRRGRRTSTVGRDHVGVVRRRSRTNGDAGVHLVASGRRAAEHPAGVVVVGRLAEDLAVDVDRGVGGDHDRSPVAARPPPPSRRQPATYVDRRPRRRDVSSMSAGRTSKSSRAERAARDRRGDADASTSRAPPSVAGQPPDRAITSSSSGTVMSSSSRSRSSSHRRAGRP